MARSSERYVQFARYYDFIYDDLVDYEGDVRYLEALFRRYMERPCRSVLDLGCGTGNHALRFARRSYEVTGLDVSRHQLAIARGKQRRAGLRIRFVERDMRSFRLAGRFDASVCLFGGFGYLRRTADVLSCLRSVHRHLAADGLFVFECCQSSGAKPAPYHDWFHKVGPEYELVRLGESRFNPRTQLLPIDFRFFVFRGKRLRDRFVETHTIRMFRTDEIKTLLRRSGFHPLGIFAATNTKKGFQPVRRSTFRMMVVARPRGV